MKILSHRGIWKTPKEKNSKVAFSRSFSKGFGTETDVRDYLSQLVIAHDIADSKCLNADEFFNILKKENASLHVAINIKADGLQKILLSSLSRHNITNYFVFDMSIPDMKIYIDMGFKVFTRQSEYEKNLPFYEKVEGVWMDAFQNTWYNEKTISQHLKNQKKVCIVSAELHRRNHLEHWIQLKKMYCFNSEKLMLCTDFPLLAEKFFNQND